MKNFVTDIAKNFCVSAAVTLGMFTAMGIWGAGLADIVEEKTEKLLSKKEGA